MAPKNKVNVSQLFFPQSSEACSAALLFCLQSVMLVSVSGREHMEEHQVSCPAELDGFRKAVKSLVDALLHHVEEKFKEDVKVQRLHGWPSF